MASGKRQAVFQGSVTGGKGRGWRCAHALGGVTRAGWHFHAVPCRECTVLQVLCRVYWSFRGREASRRPWVFVGLQVENLEPLLHGHGGEMRVMYRFTGSFVRRGNASEPTLCKCPSRPCRHSADRPLSAGLCSCLWGGPRADCWGTRRPGRLAVSWMHDLSPLLGGRWCASVLRRRFLGGSWCGKETEVKVAAAAGVAAIAPGWLSRSWEVWEFLWVGDL